MMLPKFEVGERVICDLDNRAYYIEWIRDRNIVEKTKGVKLIGNIILLKDKMNNTVHVYDWEISKLH